MKHRNLLSIALLAAAMAPLSSEAAIDGTFYAPTSVLGSGKWVKVGIESTGIYEISYDALRAMGFENPEKVAVFGRGGRVLPMDFTDGMGNSNIDNDLNAVAVKHLDNKLYFYGCGVEDISFSKNDGYPTLGYFTNNGLNIYTNRGYYFLTDSRPAKEMTTVASGSVSGLKRIDYGVSYVYHEKDLAQNHSNTGQLFWGEKFNGGQPSQQTWDVTLPDADTSTPGAMECVFYVDNTTAGQSGEQIRYGLTGGGIFGIINPEQTTGANYLPQGPTVSAVSIPSSKAKAYINYNCGANDGGVANLDWWVISYRHAIPKLGAGVSQQYFVLPESENLAQSYISFPESRNFVLLDVTTPSDPKEIGINRSGVNGNAVISHTPGVIPEMVVFDKSVPQKQICGYDNISGDIANQNVHALAAEGADMAIITLEEFRPQAELLAKIHAENDGSKVVVVTASELYNEFSAGNPDPMAYRSFAKMMHLSKGRSLKNLLLMGPVYGDFRGIQVAKDPSKGLIAYQEKKVNMERGAMNCNDFYGILADNVSTKDLEKYPMDVAVALLPVYFQSEADMIIDKIQRYLDDDSFAYRLSSMLTIGGTLNNHIHDTQAIDIASLFKLSNNNASVVTPLMINAYGYDQGREKLFESFNLGQNFSIYFGHGGPSQLGPTKDFFTGSHVSQLRNDPLPFMMFAGCLISNCDRGQRGLGESLVLDTRHGLIGSLLATRDTWSGQNYDLAKYFFQSFYKVDPSRSVSPVEEFPLTIGEVYKKAKSLSTFNNELAYQLICDPQIRIPVTLRTITCNTAGLTTVPGQEITLEGYVNKYGGTVSDADFNGEVVVRIMQPAKTLTSQDVIQPEVSKLDITYENLQIAMAASSVSHGHFKIKLRIPTEAVEFEGRQCKIIITAYDHERKLGASCYKNTTVKPMQAGMRPFKDMTEPNIEELYYNEMDNSIVAVASDDQSLNYNMNGVNAGFKLYIDGRLLGRSAFAPLRIDPVDSKMTRTVTLDNLEYGNHTARVEVSDLGGNIARREITFSYLPASGRLRLSLDEDAVNDKANFTIEGPTFSSGKLIVMNNAGTIVAETEFEGNNFEWNRKALDGSRLPAGHYRGYIIETGNKNSNGHSPAIDIPVI